MTKEAINSFRALFLSTLGILLLWFTTYPSAVFKLELYSNLADLYEWLYLRDGLPKYIIDVFEFKPDERIDHHIVTHESGDGYYAEEEKALTLEIFWPDVKEVSIELIPADHYRMHDSNITDLVRIYRVAPKSYSGFPANEYFAVFLKGLRLVKIIPIHDRLFLHNSSLGLRQVIQAAHERHKFSYWNNIRLHLLKYGYDQGVEKLTTQSEALARLRTEADVRTPEGGVKVFGLQLSIISFFSSVGILLAAAAFTMIGPLLEMRSAGPKTCQDPWIFLLPFRRSLSGGVLELAIIIISFCWAVSPLFILSQQRSLEILLGDFSGFVLSIGKLGLLFATVIQVIAAYQLVKVRWSSA
jgi:hypothetical protein